MPYVTLKCTKCGKTHNKWFEDKDLPEEPMESGETVDAVCPSCGREYMEVV